MASNLKDWNSLPLNALVQIFSYLNPGDRRNAANTCRSWSKILESPDIWRSLGCLFCTANPFFQTDIPVPFCQGANAIRIVARCAPWLRRLWIKGMMDVEYWEYIPETVSPMIIVLIEKMVKTENPPQLEELYLLGSADSVTIEEDDILEELILLLARFLRTQKALRNIRIEWKLPVLYGALLLDALGTSSCNTMSRISIEECFNSFSICSSGLIRRSLKMFSNLYSLHVRVGDLTDETLKVLLEKCKILRIIRIFCNRYFFAVAPQELNFISSKAWQETKLLSPEIRIEFALGPEVSDIQTLKLVLPREVPLVWLYCESVAQQVAIIEYLKNFSTTLESLYLDFYPNYGTEWIENSLIDLIQSSPKLSILRIAAKLPLVIVNELCNLKIESKTALKTLDITFQNLSFEEENQLDFIKYSYQPVSDSRFRDFQVDSEYTINWMNEEFADTDEEYMDDDDYDY